MTLGLRMSELPQGWETVNLGEVAEFEMGQAPPGAFCNKEGNGTVFVKAGEFGIDHPQVREWTTQPLKFAHRGDVLICVVGATSGKLNLGIDCAIGRSVAAIRPGVAASQKIIYRQLQLQVAQLRADSSGTAQGVISKQMLADIQLVLPPVAEQTRIANQLDALLTRVQACNDRFDAIPALLKRFRQTVFDAATTGALTQDWRDAQNKTAHKSLEPGWVEAKALHALPPGWRWARFSEFLSGFRSGTSAVPSSDPSAYPVLRSSSVRPMGIDFEDVRHLPNLTKVRADDLLVEGEVLFTRLSGSLEYVANCAVVRGLGDRKIYYPDRLFRARLIRPEQGTYFELCFASPLLRKHLTVEAKSTAGHQRISMGAVTDFPVPMPPDDEQTEIVRRVEALFALADRIEARCTAARARVQRLTPLVLAKAFRGELVPQDPNDEPASALLARIASSNTAGAGKSRRKVPVPRKERAQAAINL